MKNRTVVYGNFVCTFGEKSVLIDNFEDIVGPAFLDKNLKYEARDKNYFLSEQQIFRVKDENDKDDVLIFGRLIKDFQFTREFRLGADGRSTEAAHAELETAEVSLFALVLSTHRLIFLPITDYAPTMGNFAATARYLIKEYHKLWVDSEYETRANQENKITKKSLYDKIPKPNVNVISLTHESNLIEFLSRFRSVNRIRFKLIRPNEEENYDGLFDEGEKARKSAKSDSTLITHSNSSGLDKEAITDQASAALRTGHTDVSVSGRSLLGEKLSGDNKEFQLKTILADVPDKPEQQALLLHEFYKNNVLSGDIKIDHVKKANPELLIRAAKLSDEVSYDE